LTALLSQNEQGALFDTIGHGLLAMVSFASDLYDLALFEPTYNHYFGFGGSIYRRKGFIIDAGFFCLPYMREREIIDTAAFSV